MQINQRGVWIYGVTTIAPQYGPFCSFSDEGEVKVNIALEVVLRLLSVAQHEYEQRVPEGNWYDYCNRVCQPNKESQ